MLNEKKTRRLNVLRYGLVTVTAVAFALGASMAFLGSGQLWKAVFQGLLLAAGMAVLNTIIYFLYRSYLEKSP
jgi:VIT1/CCC1 family predicted Fe2+/Mn2+ transporter